MKVTIATAEQAMQREAAAIATLAESFVLMRAVSPEAMAHEFA